MRKEASRKIFAPRRERRKISRRSGRAHIGQILFRRAGDYIISKEKHHEQKAMSSSFVAGMGRWFAAANSHSVADTTSSPWLKMIPLPPWRRTSRPSVNSGFRPGDDAVHETCSLPAKVIRFLFPPFPFAVRSWSHRLREVDWRADCPAHSRIFLPLASSSTRRPAILRKPNGRKMPVSCQSRWFASAPIGRCLTGVNRSFEAVSGFVSSQ